MNLRFKIPFDRSTYIVQSKLVIRISCEKLLKKRNWSILLGSFFILLGALILLGGGDVGLVYVILGLVAYLDAYIKNEKFKTYRNKVLDAVLYDLDNDLSISDYGILDFSEEYLTFENSYLCNRTRWKDFEEFKFTRSNLFLVVEKESGFIYVIGKEEIGKNDFKRITEFVKSKT